MIVSGFSPAGAPVRSPAQISGAAAPLDPEKSGSEEPTYFRSISAISHGSLASAYQALRAHETVVLPAMPAGEPAILSGMSIPGALDAYREASETG